MKKFWIVLAVFSLVESLLFLGSSGRIPWASSGGLGLNTTHIQGQVSIVWGDPLNGQGDGQVQYTLTIEAGEVIPLDMPDPLPLPYESLVGLADQLVVVEGYWTPSTQSEESLVAIPFQVTKIQSVSEPQSPGLSGSQPWVTILCKFNDVATEPKAPAYFNGMYSSSFPGLDHYWREQSFDQINLLGSSSVSMWYTLPQPRSYYVYNMDADPELEFDKTRATTDCTAVADAVINYNNYVGIQMMFNGDLDGFAWGGYRTFTLDGTTRIWYMTWEPPWGYADIAVIAHEMGHGFGLPHSSGMYGQTYDNQWDVMSDTWSNCGNLSDPTYGCLGQHTISYHKDLESWLGARRLVVEVGNQATITLEQLAQPPAGNYLMVKIPINGSTTHFYTVETRRKVGYDLKLPGQAVIIHEVDTTRERPARVVDPDGNGNTGDAGAMWTVGETFADGTNQISVSVLSATGTGFVIQVANQASSATWTPTHTATVTLTPTPTLAPGVRVTGAETFDTSWVLTAIFNPGETVRYGGQITNDTGLDQIVNRRWTVVGPCGTLLNVVLNNVTASNGIWWYGMDSALPLDACGGVYTFTFQATYNGNTTSAEKQFTVTGSTTTPTSTATQPAVQTPTPTPTSSPTGTATSTSTPTGTSVATATATSTPTPTGTSIATATTTSTPSGTSIATATTTSTSTPTGTSVATATATSTSTPTGMSVATATTTSTPTPTGTSIATATQTPTPTRTATGAILATRTPTQTPTGTATPQQRLYLPLVFR